MRFPNKSPIVLEKEERILFKGLTNNRKCMYFPNKSPIVLDNNKKKRENFIKSIDPQLLEHVHVSANKSPIGLERDERILLKGLTLNYKCMHFPNKSPIVWARLAQWLAPWTSDRKVGGSKTRIGQ
jgi:hypothetical protein